MEKTNTYLVVFEDKKIRRIRHNDEWWFVIEDIVAILTNSKDPKGYIKDMRRRDEELSKGWGQIATLLKVETSGGVQNTNCANTEGIFRIIQSIPSPKAEPFKLWLAKVGYDRVKERENPELAQKRIKEIYKAKGYSDDWIEKRVRGIAIRDELTDEWSGIYLSAFINKHSSKDEEFLIITEHLNKVIHCIGYDTTKKITVQGNTGNYTGQFIRDGIIKVQGSAGDWTGYGASGGVINMRGKIESISNCWQGGKIYEQNKLVKGTYLEE